MTNPTDRSGPLELLLNRTTPAILDGAMGTELQRRGVDIGLPLWSANALVNAPDVVLQIHKDYIAAGADIITTNTFRTNRRVFRNAKTPDRSRVLTNKAVQLAKQARDAFPDRHVLIAGSMAPVEDCYSAELVPSDAALQDEHAELAERLARAGVDFILVETMTTIREAYSACAAAKNTGKEVIVSFACRSDGRLYGGDLLADAVSRTGGLLPTAFSLNCTSPRHLKFVIGNLKSAISNLQLATRLPFAVYANVGHPNERQGATVLTDVGVEEYAECAEEWRELGAAIIGGCCGTTPEYILRLARHFL